MTSIPLKWGKEVILVFDNSLKKHFLRFAVIVITALAFVCAGQLSTYAASNIPTASAQVNAKKGVYLRASASKSSKKVVKVKNNAKITLIREVFVKNDKTNNKYRWYYVKTSKGKKGYIRVSKVDHIKYKSVKGITTDALNYRLGPNTEMKRIGTFNRKTVINVIGCAVVKGDRAVWYKVRHNKKIYYVSSDWVKLGAANVVKTAATPDAVLTRTNLKIKPDGPPSFTSKDATYPSSLLEKMSFSLKGTLGCTQMITSAKFGIMNSAGKWVISKEVNVGSSSFNISKVDAAIKFGTLPPGKYTYVGILNVWGKNYTRIRKPFTVRKSTGAQKISIVAQQLAWPHGTSKSVFGKRPTAAYRDALDQVYPNHKSWGVGPRTGASCDVFVGTVCRYSGVDKDVPRKLNDIHKYMKTHKDKWVKVPYHCHESELVSGDVIIYHYKSGGQHICIYVNIDGEGYVAEANYPSKYYGFTNSSINKIFRTSDKKDLEVYRAAK